VQACMGLDSKWLKRGGFEGGLGCQPRRARAGVRGWRRHWVWEDVEQGQTGMFDLQFGCPPAFATQGITIGLSSRATACGQANGVKH